MTANNQQDGRHYINEFYTLREEVLNSLTHGVGTILAIAALITLIVLGITRGTGWHVAAYSIYGVTLILLFLASTVYHTVQHTPLRPVFRRIDHAAIYIFIAGSYTPFALIGLRGPLGWTLLVIIWGLAIAGILFKIWFINRWVVLSTLAYVGMGWLGVIAFPKLIHILPTYGTVLLIAGGVIYTLGVIFYALERLPYNHAIWHVFILAASACHFVAILSLLNVL
ncbi:MAG: hemolysin III family protein [Chloroflexota bacterium]